MVITAFSLPSGGWPRWWIRPPGLLARCLGPFIARWMRAKHRRIARTTMDTSQVPVVVIGNIVLGGTGKTPVVANLVTALRAAGFSPGIVSRGYGRSGRTGTRAVTPYSDPVEVGDEPVMLAAQCGVPLIVGARRRDAVHRVIHDHSVDVVVCDDGLQHEGLGRDLSICVFSATQGIGNGQVLPFGPLREPLDVVNDYDAVVVRHTDDAEAALVHMGVSIQQPVFQSLNGSLAVYRSDQPDTRWPLTHFSGQTFQAVAGIANPKVFFDGLQDAGLLITEHVFADNHAYTEDDVALLGEPLITTEKDAVKLVHLSPSPIWVVALETEQAALNAWVIAQLQQWSTT